MSFAYDPLARETDMKQWRKGGKVVNVKHQSQEDGAKGQQKKSHVKYK